MKNNKVEKEKCSLFEEMLMWTSYRYCIGRHTYVNTLAGEMAQYYYGKLTDNRMEFTAEDIRKAIYDHLIFLPFSFEIHRTYDSDPFNPIDVLLGFFEINNINSNDEFIKFSKIQYDAHTDTYKFNKSEPTIKSYFSTIDIEDLIPWETLAACFDKRNHKLITVEYNGKTETYECFKTWKRKTVPVEDKPGYVRNVDFGWKPIWVSVDNYIEKGNYHSYINEDFIKKIEDYKEKEKY